MQYAAEQYCFLYLFKLYGYCRAEQATALNIGSAKYLPQITQNSAPNQPLAKAAPIPQRYL